MKNYRLNLILFILTFFTTTGAGMGLAYRGTLDLRLFLDGISFSLSLMLILGLHELSHYYASEMHGVRATLPYFIPFPSIIGTFGAFIRIKSPINNRKSLFDIGIAGPLASFTISVPLFILGLKLSRILPAPTETQAHIGLGESIIVWALTKLVYPGLPQNYDILLHPVGFAAWIGFWVTSINLIPISQLDGGHISYAVFGEKQRIISRIFFLALLPLGLLWPGWLIWALVIILFIKLDHPAPIEPAFPLDRKRKYLSILALIMFILTFMPSPFVKWKGNL